MEGKVPFEESRVRGKPLRDCRVQELADFLLKIKITPVVTSPVKTVRPDPLILSEILAKAESETSKVQEAKDTTELPPAKPKESQIVDWRPTSEDITKTNEILKTRTEDETKVTASSTFQTATTPAAAFSDSPGPLPQAVPYTAHTSHGPLPPAVPYTALTSHGPLPPAVPYTCLLYTSPSPRDRQKSRMPSSA